MTFTVARSLLALTAAALFGGSALAQEPIKVGVIAPLTGAGAAWGLAMATGVEIVADRVNADGGLLVAGKKHKVQVIAYDDKYQTADALIAYNRLTRQDGAKYVFVLSSGGSLALKQSFETDKVVGFSAGYTRKLIDPSTRYLYRLYSTPNDFGRPMIDWLKTRYPNGGAKVAILNPNDESGWDLQEFQKTEFSKRSFDVVATEAYERTAKDFQSLLTRVLAKKPDIIELGVSSPQTSALIVRQARELGFDKQFTKMGGSGLREIVDIAGAQAAEGMIGVLQWDEARPDFAPIAEEYKKRRNHVASEVTISYVDSMRVLLAGIQASGAVNDPDKFNAALPTIFPIKSLQGDAIALTGEKAYGANRQLNTMLILGQVKAGKAVAIGRLNAE